MSTLGANFSGLLYKTLISLPPQFLNVKLTLKKDILENGYTFPFGAPHSIPTREAAWSLPGREGADDDSITLLLCQILRLRSFKLSCLPSPS